MNDITHTLIKALAWLGAAPFVLAFSADLLYLPLPHAAVDIFALYSLLILCFLCGSLWGQVIVKGLDRHRTFKLVFSNVILIALFLVWLVSDLAHLLPLLAAGYVLVLYVEVKFQHQGDRDVLATQPYWILRMQVTTFVVALHIAYMVFRALS